MVYVGIDPGLSGAIAWFNDDDQIIWAKMPIASKGEIDLQMLRSIIDGGARPFAGYNAMYAVVEKVHSMPGQGVASSFKFGRCYGQVQGILTGLKIPFVLITPQQWKKVVLVGYNWKGDKDISIPYVSQKYPNVSLLPTRRSKKPDNNIADAICLAEYARLSTREKANDEGRTP